MLENLLDALFMVGKRFSQFEITHIRIVILVAICGIITTASVLHAGKAEV